MARTTKKLEEFLTQGGLTRDEYDQLPAETRARIREAWNAGDAFPEGITRGTPAATQRSEERQGERTRELVGAGVAGTAAGAVGGAGLALSGIGGGALTLGAAATLPFIGVGALIVGGISLGLMAAFGGRGDDAAEFANFLAERGIDPISYDAARPGQRQQIINQYIESGGDPSAVENFEGQLETEKINRGVLDPGAQKWLDLLAKPNYSHPQARKAASWAAATLFEQLGDAPEEMKYARRNDAGELEYDGAFGEGDFIVVAEPEARAPLRFRQHPDFVEDRKISYKLYKVSDGQLVPVEVSYEQQAGGRQGPTATTQVFFDAPENPEQALGMFAEDSDEFADWLKRNGQNVGWWLRQDETTRSVVYGFFDDDHAVDLRKPLPLTGREMADPTAVAAVTNDFNNFVRAKGRDPENPQALQDEENGTVADAARAAVDETDMAEEVPEGMTEEELQMQMLASSSPETYMNQALSALHGFTRYDYQQRHPDRPLSPDTYSEEVNIGAGIAIEHPRAGEDAMLLGSFDSRTVRVLQKHLVLGGWWSLETYMDHKDRNMMGLVTPETAQAVATLMYYGAFEQMDWEDVLVRSLHYKTIGEAKKGEAEAKAATYTPPVVNRIHDADLREATRAGFQESFGRDPTKQEMNAMMSRYRAAEGRSISQYRSAHRAASVDKKGSVIFDRPSPVNYVTDRLYGKGEEVDYRAIRLGQELTQTLRGM